MAVLALVAVDREQQAQDARDRAEREADINHSMVLAGAAQQEFDNGISDLALALALEAVNIPKPPSEALRTLTTVAYGPGLRAILIGHTNVVRTVAFSPDGRWALSGSCAQISNRQCIDGELILWDLQTKTILRRFGGQSSGGQSDWVTSVAFVPGEIAPVTALSGSKDGTIILWNVETGQPIRRFSGHNGGVNRVVCSADGQTFFSASDDATILQWDMTGEIIRSFEGHTDAVNSVAISPDGQLLASASDDASLMVWDIASGEPVRRITGHTSRVTDVAFQPGNNRTFFSTSHDFTIRSWNAEDGQEIDKYFSSSKSDCLAIIPNGDAVAICADQLRIWNIGTNESLYRLLSTNYPVSSVAISPDGSQVMTGAEDSLISIYNLNIQPEVQRFAGIGDRLTLMAVSPDGERILTGTTGGEAILWDVKQGTEVRRFAKYDMPMTYMAFSPDGQQALLTAGGWFEGTNTGRIGLWDVETGQEIFRLEGQRFYPRSVAFTPDGRYVLTGSMNYPCETTERICGELIQWDATTGQEVRRFDLEDRTYPTSIDFSADGTRFITSINEPISKVVLWDMANGYPLKEFVAERGGSMYRAVLSPDEKAVLGAAGDGTLYLWDIETGALLRRFFGHEGVVTWADISQDGRYVISADESGIIILWNYATAQEIRRMKIDPTSAIEVHFSPDGQTAFSAPFDGSAVVQWQVADQPLEDLLTWVHENRHLRDFTCEERAQYRIEPLCE